ncbi:hypothetical protein PN465_05050 [Nodularia spumigena CS-584]|uniref:Uncharacterized protein n=2 Tax=Nodularia spumigena TaxID=70799 RepID=A0A166KVV4_NODSP|nr:hypothetical protein [Nodularia spumigena]AHJ29319.1 hypothetical protein NSP_29920 [Nodularia spumigena CCY9414]EAW45324.1 hypothetical protein N9414_01315 [Nodularia spumigena CCY9414]KZL51606.1 hypothetical protein A2T98_01385 [Nodularia spumigena CENA596]MDB9381599.1 hypothetical protein [Nodularia spumigena CS-584]MEA5524989.1 hypothetical protein [Nodularia spumigena UHCC 0143]
MADAIQNVDIDSTISALQRDLTSIPTDQAVAIINNWQQELSGTDLAEDLGELKEALLSGDTSSIAEILVDLGEDTQNAAANATGDVATKVQRLGELLSQAGNSLQ